MECTPIQIKVCEDTIYRMEQAQKRKNEDAFNLEKGNFLDLLKIIKAADPSLYSKYAKFGEMTFHAID